jgi:hypothetical protein
MNSKLNLTSSLKNHNSRKRLNMTTSRTILLSATAILAATTFCTFAGRGGGAGGGGAQAPVTLTRPETPTKAPSPDGFIQRWLVLDPISASGVTQNAVQAMVKKEYFPNQFTVIPRDGDKVTAGDTELVWHAMDTKDYNFNLYHFSNGLNKPSNNVLYWVVTIVNCPEEMSGVRLAIGSNDASVWWFNGQEVCSLYGDRQAVVDDSVSKKLTLKKGANVIRAAVHNQGGATDFCARLLDSHDKPITTFTIDLAAAK